MAAEAIGWEQLVGHLPATYELVELHASQQQYPSGSEQHEYLIDLVAGGAEELLGQAAEQGGAQGSLERMACYAAGLLYVAAAHSARVPYDLPLLEQSGIQPGWLLSAVDARLELAAEEQISHSQKYKKLPNGRHILIGATTTRKTYNPFIVAKPTLDILALEAQLSGVRFNTSTEQGGIWD